jgi:pimeloyl-ACP methyl ester carboxylesterase
MKFLVQNQPCYAYTGTKPFDAAKPTILFLHGAANDHSVWQLQARYFAYHGYNAIAVDLPGHGKSAGEAKASIGDYARWVLAFLDNAVIPKAVLVGHSMGSLIALETAAQFPDRVEKIALVGASVPMPVSDVLLNAAKDDPETAYDMLNLWGHGPAAKLGRSPSPGMALLGNYRRLLAQSAPGLLYRDLKNCAEYQPSADALKRIAAPALILTGSRDQMTPPKAGAAVAKMLGNARVHALENTGHSMMTEAPDDVLDALKHFAAA